MKKLILILFPICLLACESGKKQVIVEPPGPIEAIIEEEEKSAQIYLDTYPFLGNVLLVNEPNDIVVHLTDVNPKDLIVEMGEETLGVDKYGNIRYTPKKVGKIDLSVFIMSDGVKTPYGKAMFRVMSAETTLGEIYLK